MSENPNAPPTRSICHIRARLADGGSVVLRPLRGGETQVLESVFDGLSPWSRQQRYLVPTPRLTPTARRTLADVGSRDHVAWVAMVDGSPVGICRYVRTSPHTAEVAFEVVDAEQGRGIASVLIDAVTTVAHANQIESLEAAVAPGNAAAVALLARVGVSLVLRDGLLEGRGRLRLSKPPRVDRRAVLRLASQASAQDGHEAQEVSTQLQTG